MTYVWQPTSELIERTTLSAFLRRHGIADQDALCREADARPAWFWDALLRFFEIRFDQPYSNVLDVSRGIEWPVWCEGGTTNIVTNCLLRHRGSPIWDRDAIIWEGEGGAVIRWSFARLDAETARLATILRQRGIQQGDVVGLYLPMLPEAVATFLAIVEIGAIAMPMFSGFGPQPLFDRLSDSGAKAIVTCPGTVRRGKPVPMLDTVRSAIAELPMLHTVVVLDRAGDAQPGAGREIVLSTADEPPQREREPDMLPAETPAMLMYTSGTTGKPKGTVHTHCGILAKNALDMGLCIDLQASDRLLWMSDMGWIVGPKVSVGCTLLGATLVLAEGTPDWPESNRIWRLCSRHGVSVVGIVPTAVRQMMRTTTDPLEGTDLSRLRTVISSGEPWTPEAWTWFFETICKKRIPILNYAGGTECGGAILIGTHHKPLKPCAFGGPVPGNGADVVDASGVSLPAGQVGELVMRRATIGATRGLWNDPQRYIEGYWQVIPGMWIQGDLASRDEEGLWYLHGRSDDTIKLAGKRVGPAEIEAALIASGLVADTAVVGIPDDLTGSALLCACIAAGPVEDGLAKRISDVLAQTFGAPFRPKRVLFVSDLPRTRNQKIMRRVVRALATHKPTGDLTSLANPDVVEELRQAFAHLETGSAGSSPVSHPSATHK
ncbi:MAG: AMP-binding protein [Beijerinckiaceae bacterium]|nr:AMP-binding protein [Beijerinckiaceae bacterium]